MAVIFGTSRNTCQIGNEHLVPLETLGARITRGVHVSYKYTVPQGKQGCVCVCDTKKYVTMKWQTVNISLNHSGMWCYQRMITCHVDHESLSLCNFNLYKPSFTSHAYRM